jgi:hypothetical protein
MIRNLPPLSQASDSRAVGEGPSEPNSARPENGRRRERGLVLYWPRASLVWTADASRLWSRSRS